MNVLIIDNSNLFQKILSDIFLNTGITPLLADKASVGMEILRTDKIDFICVSMFLSDTDGLSFIKKIRKTRQYTQTPIILFTSEESSDIYGQALLSGCTEVFQKKDVSQLVNFIHRFTIQQQQISGRILYIEDSLSQQQVVISILKNKGLEVDAYSTAEEAFIAYKNKQYNLIVTDVVLEGKMTGMSLINHIRRLDGMKGDIPILALTAFDDISRRIELFYLGVSDYVIKPIIEEELLARVRNLINTNKFHLNLIEQRKLTKQSENMMAAKVRELDFQKYALDEHAIVSIANHEGNITYVNSKLCQVSGYTPDELIGNNHRILNSGFHPKEFFITMWQTISTGNTWHNIIKNIRKDGSYYWVDATIVPFMDKNGKPFQYIAIRTDVTQQILIKEALKKSKKIAETSRKKAEEANQAKSEFLSSMNHELRTPLNAILGFAQILDFNPKEPLSPSQKEYVGHIKTGGQHLLTLINDILELAKIESGKLELSMESISLGEAIEECLPFITGMAEQRGITFSIDDCNELVVYADSIRLKQVLLNLLSNAIKYNHENGTVSINIKQQANNNIYIGVSDTGIGVAENKQNQLFKAFNRLGVDDLAIEGTGLGLVVSKEMVQQMNGTIGMHSTEGQGSTFWIELLQAN